MRLTRRGFLLGTAGLAGSSALALSPGLSAAFAGSRPRFRRYDVASPQGQRMLVSYARGIEVMLRKPASDPLNWFRNAFVHFLDCPHGNWWFYVWHRGYIGHFERTIRRLSGDPNFTLPFWDWTSHPELPESLFRGVLTPTAEAFAPYTGNLVRFTEFIKPSLQTYWNGLSKQQREQLEQRGYSSLDDAWTGVSGAGDAGNMAFAITCGSRYPTLANRKLDATTSDCVSARVVASGLSVQAYHDPDPSSSFTSVKTPSHHLPPTGGDAFSILEGQPHNKLHNYIGGYYNPQINPGPFGNMSNNLSPVDPIFMLHHSNMDRLWDVWTRRQISAGLPIEPTGPDREQFMQEPFLFFVDSLGKSLAARAGDYFSTAVFDYDYAPGYGSGWTQTSQRLRASGAPPILQGTVNADSGRVNVPLERIQTHLSESTSAGLLAEVTIQRPTGLAAPREFTILVNAPAELNTAEPGSPYYAGTVAFFGPTMSHHESMHQGMAKGSTFVVPLPRSLKAFQQPKTLQGSVPLEIRVVPSTGEKTAAPLLQRVAIRGR